MSKTIIGDALPNMPWQEKPVDCDDVVWRYNNNPVIGRKAVKKRIIIPIKKGVKYFTFFESVLITLNNNNKNKMIPMIVVSNL